MENFLQVHNSNNLPASPTNSFLADEVASICPLITPSPPTNDLINPLNDSSESNYKIGEDLVTMLQHVQDNEKNVEDSASSSSSTMAEPACTQLLNHRNTYFHIQKDEHIVTEETTGKIQQLQLTFRNPPDNYFFMSWNWPLIRRISLWVFLSGLIAMVALVIAMISSLPKTCNPYTKWYQGKVMYEIFPASFFDSNNDMYGDFRGIAQKSDYIKDLGVASVRLNPIFQTDRYPEDYNNIKSLTKLASKQLGDIEDFRSMMKHLKSRNISLVLDLPVYPAVKELAKESSLIEKQLNNSEKRYSVESLIINNIDLVEQALFYWIQNGVDGFYLKGLEHFCNDPNLVISLRRWKRIVGSERPLIISENLLKKVPSYMINTILHNVDLIDIRLNVEGGSNVISQQILQIQNGSLFERVGGPWILWNIGDDSSPRLADSLPYGNATLGATLLQLMLPGTPSIFYGNEIGLQKLMHPDGEDEEKDIEDLHQLGPMVWPMKRTQAIYWIHGEQSEHLNFRQADAIRRMINLRTESPSIYINAVNKEGDNKANADVKYSTDDLLVIQRWFPRRKSYVVVSNLGSKRIVADLSTMLYSGIIVIGPGTDSKSGSISFKNIALWPGESVIILLD